MKERITFVLKYPYHVLMYLSLHKCKVEDVELGVMQVVLNRGYNWKK